MQYFFPVLKYKKYIFQSKDVLVQCVGFFFVNSLCKDKIDKMS